MSKKTIVSMVDWVEENIRRSPTIKDMADHVGYSSYYCSTKFHEYTGITFKEYVLNRKLSLAAMTLQDSQSKIIDIAVSYGFSSNEAFTRAFRNQYGYTPSRYRKEKPVLNLLDKVDL